MKWTKKHLENLSQSARARNPHLFGAVVGLRSEKPKPNQRDEVKNKQLEQSQKILCYRIVITVFRKRLLDEHDNSRSACKALVDIITTSLDHINDSCKELQWEYHQIKTSGRQGTLVHIQEL